jgi:hypothetical protein
MERKRFSKIYGYGSNEPPRRARRKVLSRTHESRIAPKMMMNVHDPPNVATLSASCQLIFKLTIGIAANREAFTEMLSDPLLTFRERIKVSIKLPLHKISQVILHGRDYSFIGGVRHEVG